MCELTHTHREDWCKWVNQLLIYNDINIKKKTKILINKTHLQRKILIYFLLRKMTALSLKEPLKDKVLVTQKLTERNIQFPHIDYPVNLSWGKGVIISFTMVPILNKFLLYVQHYTKKSACLLCICVCVHMCRVFKCVYIYARMQALVEARGFHQDFFLNGFNNFFFWVRVSQGT